MRIAAWGKRRKQTALRKSPVGNTPLAYQLIGGALIVFGLVASATGVYWQEAVSAFLLAPQWSATLELWLPYWPFQPYLSLFIIGIGAQSISDYLSLHLGRAKINRFSDGEIQVEINVNILEHLADLDRSDV